MNEKLTQIDLFSGIGGFSLAGEWAGFETIAFCENEPYCQEVLKARFGGHVVDTNREFTRGFPGDEDHDADETAIYCSRCDGWYPEKTWLSYGGCPECGRDVADPEGPGRKTRTTDGVGEGESPERSPCVPVGQDAADSDGKGTGEQGEDIHKGRKSQTFRGGGLRDVPDTESGIPIIPDIRDFDGTRFRGATILTGGFPCQPFSIAGKRGGKEDDRFLWPEMLRVIKEAKPAWVIAENVAGIVHLALGQVLSDLEGCGYDFPRDTEGFPIVPIIPASAVNAPHRRDRVWIIAYAVGAGVGSDNGPANNEGRRSGQDRGKGLRQGIGEAGPGRPHPATRDAHDTRRVGHREENSIQAGRDSSIGTSRDASNTQDERQQHAKQIEAKRKNTVERTNRQDDPNAPKQGLEGSGIRKEDRGKDSGRKEGAPGISGQFCRFPRGDASDPQGERNGGGTRDKCGMPEREVEPEKQSRREMGSEGKRRPGLSNDPDANGMRLQKQGSEQQADRDRQSYEAPSGTDDGDRYCPHCDEWYPESSWYFAPDGKCPDCERDAADPKSRDPRKPAESEGREDPGRGSEESGDDPNSKSTELEGGLRTRGRGTRPPNDSWESPWLEIATRFCRVDDGLPAWIHRRRVKRLKALGNAIVPQVAHEILRCIAEIERSKTDGDRQK